MASGPSAGPGQIPAAQVALQLKCWAAGIYIDNCDPSLPRRYWRVVTTCDGGRTATA